MCQLHGPEIRPPSPSIRSWEQFEQLCKACPQIPRWALLLNVVLDYGHTPEWMRSEPEPF